MAGGGRRRLTKDLVLDTALELVDDAGLDALSMRRLGAELGVDPMAIYRHVPGKDALLQGLVERVFAEMPTPTGRGPWTRRVRQWAHGYRSVAQAHPNLVLRIVTDPVAVAIAAAHANETLYRALEASGLPRRDVVRAADAVVDFVNGSVLGASAGDVHAELHDALHAALDAQPDEAVAAQRRVLERGRHDGGPDSFDFGLDLLLEGLRRRAEGRPRPPLGRSPRRLTEGCTG